MSSYLIISGEVNSEQDYVMATYNSNHPLFEIFKHFGIGAKKVQISSSFLYEIRDYISDSLSVKNKLLDICRISNVDDISIIEELVVDTNNLNNALHELNFLFTLIDHIKYNSCGFNALNCYIG
jgi:hypothetical protein